MKTIVIIPARGGSKRLPEKNIKLLDGKPLIVHSIAYAKAHNNSVEGIFVSTDDEKIKQVALANNAIVIDRPESLSGDFEPTVSALKHVLESIEEKPEIVILLQPTNPLRPKELLDKALDIFIKNNCDSLFTVTRNEQKLGKINAHRFVPFNYEIGQRSQDLEPLYFENGLLYITRVQLILEENRIISEKAYPMIVEHPFAAIDIDTQDDFEYASYLQQKYKEQ